MKEKKKENSGETMDYGPRLPYTKKNKENGSYSKR